MSDTKHAVMRGVLLNSKRWQDITAQLDVMKLAKAPPLDMSRWKHEDFAAVWDWAQGNGDDEPPKVLEDYLETVR